MSADETRRALPSGWVWSRISDAGEVKLGRQRSPVHHVGPHMRPYLRVANVFEDRLDLSDVKHMNFTPTEFPAFQLRHGDILLNEGQSPHLVGRAALWRDEIPGACFQNTLIRFRARTGIDPRYALIVFRAQLHMLRYLRIAKITTNIAHLGLERFAAVEFPIPPIAEQRRIVAAIETQFTRLDDAVATLKVVQAKLKRARASVLQAAVEGRLVPTEAALAKAEGRSYEPASALLERILVERRARWPKGKKYQPPVEPKTEDLPALPEGWTWVTVDALQIRLTSGSRDWTAYQGRGSCVFILAQNVRPGGLDLSYRQLIDPPSDDPARERSRIRHNDLLVTIVGANTGDACRVSQELPDHFVCQSVALIRIAEPRCAPYASLALTSDWIQRAWRRLMYGQGRPHLSFVQLAATCVPLPPLAEQQRIVAEVERRLSVLDSLEHTVEQSLARCARLRQSILKRAFEGRLVPQDPNDEPAHVLLERIRAERAAHEGRA